MTLAGRTRSLTIRARSGVADSGFTLVELLVVVAIIIALLAILMPSMGRAIEITHRAVCASQLHQTQTGHISFATDNMGRLTPSQLVTDFESMGAYMVWSKRLKNFGPNNPYSKYRGNGYLIKAGYLDNPRLLYCPSWKHDAIYYDGPQGWPDDGKPENRPWEYIWTSYHYRSSFNAPNWRPARLSLDSGGEILLTDHYSKPDRGVNNHHQDGYNNATLDGAVVYFDDPDNVVRDYNAGAQYNQWIKGYLLQEEVFNDVFGGDR